GIDDDIVGVVGHRSVPAHIVPMVEQRVGDEKPRLSGRGPVQAPAANSSGLVAIYRVRLNRSAPAAQHEAGVPPDAQPMRDYSAAQHVGRGDQGFSGDLAMLAKPGSDVHRVAGIRDLPLRDAALADDDGTRMNTGAEP